MDNGAEYTFFVKTSHFWAEAGRSHLFIYYFFFLQFEPENVPNMKNKLYGNKCIGTWSEQVRQQTELFFSVSCNNRIVYVPKDLS